MRIHREGYKIIFWALTIASAIQYCIIKYTQINTALLCLEALISFVFCFWVVYFFRDPKIKINHYSNGVLSPATGTVVSIQEIREEEYFKDRRLQVCIFMSPLDVHVNRNPISGVIKFFKHHQGKYLVAWHPKSSTKNERTTIVVQSENGVEILFRQIAGFVARRICYYDSENKHIKQGEECGFIKFGSRADVFLPLDSSIKVKIGDKMKAGISIIADLNV